MNIPRQITRAGSSAFAALVLTLTQMAHAQHSPAAPDDLAREVVDIDREIAVLRRAREALAADIEEFDSSLDGTPPASQRAGSRPATSTTPAPSLDPLRQARDTVDVDAEIAEARQVRARLSEELQRLVHGLAGADARLASVKELRPRVAALSSRVETLQQRLEESRGAEIRTAQARDALAVELEKLQSERGLQQAILDTVQRRLEEMSSETSGTREATDLALASLEAVYSERVSALEQRLSQARATERDLRDQLKEAGTQREELRAQAAVAPLMAADRAEAARMATQVQSLTRELASLRAESADARVELQAAYESRGEELERQLTDLASKETAAREGLLQANARTEQVRESLSGKVEELLASLDELTGSLAGEREEHADTRTRLAALQAERAEQAELPDIAGALRDQITELRREAEALRGAREQRIVALHTERGALQQQAADLRAQLADSVAREETLDDDVAALGGTLDATRAERDDLREQLAALAAQTERELRQVEQERSASRSEIAALSEQLTELQTEAGRELDSARAKLAALQGANTTLREQIGALQGETREQQARSAAERAELVGERDVLRSTQARYEEQLVSLVGERDGLGERLDALQSQMRGQQARSEEQLASLVGERDALRERLDALQRQVREEQAQSEGQLASLAGERDGLREGLDALQGQMRGQQARSEEQLASLVGERDALRERLDAVQRQVREEQARSEGQLASLAGERDGLRERLDALQGQMRGQQARSEEQLASLAGERDALREQLASSNDQARQDLRGARAELGALREENAALLGKLTALEAELEQISSQAPESEPDPAPRTHVVQRGETLSIIARQYLGDAGRWRLIYEANREQISNPDVVEPGTALVIPTP